MSELVHVRRCCWFDDDPVKAATSPSRPVIVHPCVVGNVVGAAAADRRLQSRDQVPEQAASRVECPGAEVVFQTDVMPSCCTRYSTYTSAQKVIPLKRGNPRHDRPATIAIFSSGTAAPHHGGMLHARCALTSRVVEVHCISRPAAPQRPLTSWRCASVKLSLQKCSQATMQEDDTAPAVGVLFWDSDICLLCL